MQFELTREFIDHLEDAIERGDNAFIQEYLSEMHCADITAIFSELSLKNSRYIYNLLDGELKAEVISEIDEDDRLKYLKEATPQGLSELIEFIETDDAADILNALPLKIRQETIALLNDKEKATHILDLLRYDEDTAGGLMAKELIKANHNWTVVQTIEEIRRQASKVEKIFSIYVVDDNDILLGRVSLKKLVLASDDTKVSDLYEEDLVYVESFAPDEEVTQKMSRYDLTAIPVVNFQGKLLGRITIDDVVDVITEQAETDRQLMTGISENVEFRDSIWAITRARLPWLIVGMAGGLLGAKLIGFFEKDLIAVPAMAFFIPLITATGGNVGIQSSSIVIQSLATSTSLEDEVLARLWKSFLVSFLNALAIATLVFSFNVIFLGFSMATVVGISIFSVVILASFTGTVIPFVLNKFDINPALAAGPFITTFNDLVGIAVYFTVAQMLI